MHTSSPELAGSALPQNTRRGTQTGLSSASVTAPILVIPSTSTREFKNEPPKHEAILDDDVEDDVYDDDDNFVEEEAPAYGREIVVRVASPYTIPCVYKRRFLDTQYGVRKDGDIFVIGDTPIPTVILD